MIFYILFAPKTKKDFVLEDLRIYDTDTYSSLSHHYMYPLKTEWKPSPTCPAVEEEEEAPWQGIPPTHRGLGQSKPTYD